MGTGKRNTHPDIPLCLHPSYDLLAFTSTDGGKTWKPWFDLMFRPHK